MTVNCEVCSREIKRGFTWVSCSYFGFHPVTECGGCMYPVGNDCIKKIPKEYHFDRETASAWDVKVKKMLGVKA